MNRSHIVTIIGISFLLLFFWGSLGVVSAAPADPLGDPDFLSNPESNCCTSGYLAGKWWDGCCVSSGTQCCLSSSSGCKAGDENLIPCTNKACEGAVENPAEEDPEDPEEPYEPSPTPSTCEDCSAKCPLGLTATINTFPIQIVDNFPSCTLNPLTNPCKNIIDCQLNKFQKAVKCYGCIDSPESCKFPLCDCINCYERISIQPFGSLEIYPEEIATEIGFVSQFYTGGGTCPVEGPDNCVNEPIKFRAIYRDPDVIGTRFVEALYVWFMHEDKGTYPTTPKVYLTSYDGVRKTQGIDQFGFMLVKTNIGDPFNPIYVWKAYVPAITKGGDEASDYWVPIANGETNTDFFIYGPEGKRLVKIEDLSTEGYYGTLLVEFNLSFLYGKIGEQGLEQQVKEGKYNIYLKGNDKFGFTPYDNYDGLLYDKYAKWYVQLIYQPTQIRLPQWNFLEDTSGVFVETGKSGGWNVDFTSPSVDKIEAKVVDQTKVEFEWIVNDNIGVENIVANMFVSKEVLFNGDTTISVTDFNYQGFTGTTEPVLPFDKEIGYKEDEMILGHLTENNLIRVDLDQNDDGQTIGSITIDFKGVGEGIFDFYITGVDRGGNISNSAYYAIDTRDWIITYGGLLNAQDIEYPVKSFDPSYIPELWKHPDDSVLRKITHEYADISTELVGIRDLDAQLNVPLKSTATTSYNIVRYNVPDIGVSYYEYLKGLFEPRVTSLEGIGVAYETYDSNTIPNGKTLKSLIAENHLITVLDRQGNLEIGSNFKVNTRGLIFVSGDLTIDKNIKIENPDKNALIIVVGGNVIIKSTDNGIDDFSYDEIHAYILADGIITLEAENSTDVHPKGLYIDGGLHSAMDDKNAIKILRSLAIGDRFSYPTLVVDLHPKYGVLAGILFGGDIKTQKMELGIKP